MKDRILKKSYYVFLSVLLFLIISPFFNGLFSYIYFNASSGKVYLGSEDFIFLIFIAYLVTLIPALFTGLTYGILSLTHSKARLRWLVPVVGCIIYLIYIFILQILFAFLSAEGNYLIIIFALLSIGGSFIATVIGNISLKRNIEQEPIQTK